METVRPSQTEVWNLLKTRPVQLSGRTLREVQQSGVRVDLWGLKLSEEQLETRGIEGLVHVLNPLTIEGVGTFDVQTQLFVVDQLNRDIADLLPDHQIVIPPDPVTAFDAMVGYHTTYKTYQPLHSHVADGKMYIAATPNLLSIYDGGYRFGNFDSRNSHIPSLLMIVPKHNLEEVQR